MTRRLVCSLLLVFLVVLAGCSGAETGADGGSSGEATMTTAQAATESGDGGAGSGGGGDTAADSGSEVKTGSSGGASFDARAKTQPRYRIKTANIRLTVDSYKNTRTSLVSTTRSLGGYVDSHSSDRHTRHNQSWTTGTIVLRVPAENYDQLIDAVESSGTVEHRETKTRDVTERVVDLQARLKNLKNQRDRLRDLYESANETEDILRVGERLSEVQGEIERVEGRLQVLQNQVAYSTVRIQIREEPPEEVERKTEPAWYETGMAAAFLQSVDGVLVLGRMFAVGFAYVAPYLLALGIPIAGVYGAVRRLR